MDHLSLLTYELFYVINLSSKDILLNPEFQRFSRGFNNIMTKISACFKRLIYRVIKKRSWNNYAHTLCYGLFCL